MPEEYNKFGFTAGELSPSMHGRSDLDGFQAGFREGLNVLVDWRGGIRTRPGTIMAEPLFEDATNPGVRLSTFSFNTDPEDNYLLVWKHKRLFFVREGRYLYTTQPNVLGNVLLTGFRVDDIVRVHEDVSGQIGRYLFTGKVVDGNTVCVPWKTQTVDLTTSQRVVRAYSIPTPYDAQDIHDLKLDQFRDDVTITHRRYRARVLRRTLIGESGSFNLQTISFLGPREAADKASVVRTRPNLFADSEGGFQWTVGVVDEEGIEHPVNYSDGKLETGVNIGTKYLDLTWDEDRQAQSYRVYASAFKPDFNEGLSDAAAVANTTPVLPPYGAQSGTEGESFNITLPAATGGFGTITYSIISGSLPGANFNPATRRLTSSFLTTPGIYTLTYRATDEADDFDELTFTVTVADMTVTTMFAPGVPINFSISGQTSSSITVAFEPPTDGGPPSVYRVVYSTNANITGSDPTITGSGSPITISGLNVSSTYHVAVRAENNIGNSPYTTAIQVTTSGDTPVRNSQKDISLGAGNWVGGASKPADNRMWFLDSDDDDLIAYNSATRSRVSGDDISLSSVTYAGAVHDQDNTVYIISVTNSPDRAFARNASTGAPQSGDISLGRDSLQAGAASDGTTIWFGFINSPHDLEAYDADTRARNTANDISNSMPVSGLIYLDGVIWVLTDVGGTATAYNSSTGARIPTKDISLGSGSWRAGTGANGTIWFVNNLNNSKTAIAYDI